LLIIDAGPAGIAGALEGARLGAEVTLVSATPIGGHPSLSELVFIAARSS
jgi:heterodisulfide reductase subunit A-like polyferredoxin